MASRTANQTVHFSQAALITPVLAYFENVGVPIEKYLAQADISQGLVLDQATPLDFDRGYFDDIKLFWNQVSKMGSLKLSTGHLGRRSILFSFNCAFDL